MLAPGVMLGASLFKGYLCNAPELVGLQGVNDRRRWQSALSLSMILLPQRFGHSSSSLTSLPVMAYN